MTSERLKSWVYMLGIAGGVLFWFFTIYGLPPRVERLEKIVSEHEKRLTTVDVKMDIVLDDVKTIKVLLMQKGRVNG